MKSAYCVCTGQLLGLLLSLMQDTVCSNEGLKVPPQACAGHFNLAFCCHCSLEGLDVLCGCISNGGRGRGLGVEV